MRSVGYEPPCHHTGPHLFENCYVSWHCKAEEVSCFTHFGWLQSFEVCGLKSIGLVSSQCYSCLITFISVCNHDDATVYADTNNHIQRCITGGRRDRRLQCKLVIQMALLLAGWPARASRPRNALRIIALQWQGTLQRRACRHSDTAGSCDWRVQQLLISTFLKRCHPGGRAE